MVAPPWVAEAEAGGVWRTGVKGLGMGLYRGVEEEASVLSLFPYSLRKDWGHPSSRYFLPHCQQGWEAEHPVRVQRGSVP